MWYASYFLSLKRSFHGFQVIASFDIFVMVVVVAFFIKTICRHRPTCASSMHCLHYFVYSSFSPCICAVWFEQPFALTLLMTHLYPIENVSGIAVVNQRFLLVFQWLLWKSLLFTVIPLTVNGIKITQFFHCYSSGIPMGIPAILTLVLLYCYTNENNSDLSFRIFSLLFHGLFLLFF